MSHPPSLTETNRLGIDRGDWRALQSAARAHHPHVGLIVGSCVCGAHGYQPTPPACRALATLLDLAQLAEGLTR